VIFDDHRVERGDLATAIVILDELDLDALRCEKPLIPRDEPRQ